MFYDVSFKGIKADSVGSRPVLRGAEVGIRGVLECTKHVRLSHKQAAACCHLTASWVGSFRLQYYDRKFEEQNREGSFKLCSVKMKMEIIRVNLEMQDLKL